MNWRGEEESGTANPAILQNGMKQPGGMIEARFIECDAWKIAVIFETAAGCSEEESG